MALLHPTAKAAGEAEAGGSAEHFTGLMAAETWFTAPEALAAGLLDAVKQDAPAAQARAQAWDLSAYRHAPQAPAPAVRPSMFPKLS